MRTPILRWASAALLGIAVPAACARLPDEPTRAQGAGLAGPHVFDLASHMPLHLAIMFSMGWFGIPSTDPQGAGPDPSYGNDDWQGACVAANDASTCSACVLEGAGDTCLQTGAAQRNIASRRRPLAGIYSSSAADVEGQRRVDLMLSTLRRPCDDGAKIDAWTVQLNGTRDTAAHPANPSCTTCQLAYGATQAFLGRADAAGMTGVVLPGDDSTWYFHFGSTVGLGACDDSTGNPKQNCIAALTQDFADMAALSAAHASALTIGGRPVLYTYLDPQYLTAAQWTALLESARSASGVDFYVVASSQNATLTSYFGAFDAISPWVQLDWSAFSGSTVRAHAENWAAGLHAPLYQAVASFPGRVVFGAATPGFDDFTMQWGACTERQLPPGDPRDPDVLRGEFDYFATKAARGIVMETWDDWTEGTEFEPDVAGGTASLVSLRQQLGALFGEASDPAGDARLSSRWQGYGQARNCAGGAAGVPPVTALACPDGGAPGDGGTTCATTHFGQTSNAVVGGWDATYRDLSMDVDGDGKRDLVILWNGGGTTHAQVELSNGAGFSQVSNGSLGVAWSTADTFLTGDVTGDGKDDLVRLYVSGASAFAQVFSSGASGFASVSNAAIGGSDPTYVRRLMDVDGDGKDDLVVVWNDGDAAAQVDLSNGSGFTQVSNGSLGVAWNAADRFLVGDVDGDGKQDLVRIYASGTDADAQVFASRASSFAAVSNGAVGGWNAAWVDELLDANGDGKDDLLILWNDGTGTSAQLDLSDGAGFAQVSNAPTGVAWSASNRYFVADFDADGKKDLLTLWPDGASASAQIATSTGSSFSPTSNAPVGGWSAAWVDLVGDVNGDGRSDLVVLWQDGAQPAGSDARAQVSPAVCP